MNRSLADGLFLVTSLLYLSAAVLFVAYLFGNARGNVRIAARLVAFGAVFHAAHIVVYSLVLGVCPVAGIHFPMSVVSMLSVVVYVAMRRRYRIDALGAFVAPLALTSLLASHFVGGGSTEPSPRFKSALLPVHVTMNLLGVALFSLASAAACLYLVQEHLLKTKRVEGLFQRLPALDALDKAEHRFLLAGFPLLTLGILTGTLWARRVEMGGTADIARAVFGYMMWLLAAGVLFLRAALGWRGRRAAYGTIAGFGFAVVVLILYLVRSPEPPNRAPLAATRIAPAHVDRGGS